MRLRHVAVPLVFAATLLSGCSTGSDCGKVCPEWKECVSGACLPAPGRCDADTDCDSYLPICDLASHTCISHRCDPACGDWQVCADGTCEAKEGRCDRHLDCPVLCDLDTHTCTEDFCQPACQDWQVCEQTSCVPAEGRCATNADCGGDTPVCSPVTRACSPLAGAYTEVSLEATPAVIVTTEALRAPMEALARLHTVTGVPTRVVTVEEICAAGVCDDADPTIDTPKAVKDWLLAQPGLKHVVLGGDIEEVPSRLVHDHYANDAYGVSFDEDFYTDLYYADLSEWDVNGDGVYAEDGVDDPDHLADLGLGRIPASTVAEADAYVAKVAAHLTAYDPTRTRSVLALSNVAASVSLPGGIDTDVDGASYLEMSGRTLSLLPSDAEVTKVYASLRVSGSQKLTVDLERQELEKGPEIVLHAGHGDVGLLSCEIDGSDAFTAEMAGTLVSQTPSFFLSSACLAGDFEAADSAGERLVLDPSGGAIGYLGNTATGLGIAGGSQLVDEMLRYAYDPARENPLVSDVLRGARNAMPAYDTIDIVRGVPYQVVDRDSWEWTQKSTTWLGDPLVPFWTARTLWTSPTLTVERRSVGDAAELRVSIFPPVDGELWIYTDAHLYRVDLHQTSQVVVDLPEAPSRITAGVTAAGSLSAWVDESY